MKKYSDYLVVSCGFALIAVALNDENKNFISRSTSYNFYKFTTLSNAYYIRFDINSASDTSTLQLELGSTSTSFEPYVGGIASPNPLYPQDIQSVEGIQTITIGSIFG